MYLTNLQFHNEASQKIHLPLIMQMIIHRINNTKGDQCREETTLIKVQGGKVPGFGLTTFGWWSCNVDTFVPFV